MISSTWKEQYESEKIRLLEALRRVTDGGIVESIRHIGSTSVPGMVGAPCVDIGLAVWPFPHLEPERRAWLRWALLATNSEHSWIKQL